MNCAELLLGQLPEAIFFPLFVIFCKGVKVKSKESLLFIGLSIFQYLGLKYFFHFDSWFQFIYIGMLWLDCKFLWKDKSDIVDLMYAIIYLLYAVIVGIVAYFIFYKNTFYAILLNRTLMILPFIFYKYFCNLNNIYLKYWNRNDKLNKKIKSITFRTIHVLIINILFLLINLCMIYSCFYLNL